MFDEFYDLSNEFAAFLSYTRAFYRSCIGVAYTTAYTQVAFLITDRPRLIWSDRRELILARYSSFSPASPPKCGLTPDKRGYGKRRGFGRVVANSETRATL